MQITSTINSTFVCNTFREWFTVRTIGIFFDKYQTTERSAQLLKKLKYLTFRTFYRVLFLEIGCYFCDQILSKILSQYFWGKLQWKYFLSQFLVAGIDLFLLLNKWVNNSNKCIFSILLVFRIEHNFSK